MSVESSPEQQARRYARVIRGMRAANHHCALPSMAGFIAIAPPKIPSITEYETWLSAYLATKDKRGRSSVIDARKLRRIATMRANGCKDTEIGRSIGLSMHSVWEWRCRLPKHLGGVA